MALADWLSPASGSDPYSDLLNLSNRKLHLLTAAFLRRVWDDLPSDSTRIAVDATEKHADGRMTVNELARLRSSDLLDTCEALWTDPGYTDEDLIGAGCPCCAWGPRATEYECRVAATGYVLDGVSAAVRNPGEGVLRAARFARAIASWKADSADRAATESAESLAQYDVLREITGPYWIDERWPQWRTSDVRALARGIHSDCGFDGMPILADALQEAGCDNATILAHCREPREHVRGCWVVDLAMGYG